MLSIDIFFKKFILVPNRQKKMFRTSSVRNRIERQLGTVNRVLKRFLSNVCQPEVDFLYLGSFFSPYFRADRLCKGIEKLSNTHLIVSRKMASLPVNVRRSNQKRRCRNSLLPTATSMKTSLKNRLRILSLFFSPLSQVAQLLKKKKGIYVGDEKRGPPPNSDRDDRIYRLAVPVLR